MSSFIAEIAFFAKRFTVSSLIDICLVAFLVFLFLKFIKGIQANSLLRGLVFVLIIVGMLSLLTDFPAFRWLISLLFPILIVVIPVIFAPELRRVFERMGRIRTIKDLFQLTPPNAADMKAAVSAIVDGSFRLASRKHGALIVMEQYDNLDKYISTGVKLDALITPELILQVFYPNTPLHDGAAIVKAGRIYAASCVMPLSSRNVLDKTPERHMGLRHRAALGISEETDAIVVVVSEETGAVSIAADGKILRGVTPDILMSKLGNYYQTPEPVSTMEIITGLYKRNKKRRSDEKGNN